MKIKGMPFISRILIEVCQKLNLKIVFEEEYGYAGYITTPSGKRLFFNNGRFDVNPGGAIDIANDKAYTTYFLKSFGFSVPCEKTFFNEIHNSKLQIKRNIDDGLDFALSIGFPVIVKPNSLSQGKYVFKVGSKEDYYKASSVILESNPVMLVQKYYSGKDYRFLVFNKKLYACYLKIPLSIVGNGHSSILELIDDKILKLEKLKRNFNFDVYKEQVIMVLYRDGLNFDSVLEEGRVLYLLDNANASSGGDVIDVTKEVSSFFAKVAIDAVSSMNLVLAGLDMIIDDISSPSYYTILEINSAPSMSHFAKLGDEQEIAVKKLYFDLVSYMIKYSS